MLLLGLKKITLKMVVIKDIKLALLEILALADEKPIQKGQSIFTQTQKQVKSKLSYKYKIHTCQRFYLIN